MKPLEDRRAELHEADVVQLIRAARGDYDAVMLDVDNGAEAMVPERATTGFTACRG